MKKHILSDNELFEIKAREYEKGLKDAKPEVTEEWIKAKAIELINLVGYKITGEYARHHLISVQDFIHSLIKEVRNGQAR